MASPQQQYTAEARRDALALSDEVGCNEAARRLGVPLGTMSCWRYTVRRWAAEGRVWPPVVAPGPDEDASDEELTTALAAAPSSKPKQVARVYTPSERARALELAAAVGATAASNELGMSRFSIYEWQRKEKLAAAGKGPSPTSGPDPDDIKAQRDREILSMWRKHPGLGPSQIRNQLRREQSIKVSTTTVRRVMEDAGYRPPKVKRRDHDERFEAVRPNHCWHLDFVQRWIGRASTFTLILLDDYSRFVVGHGVDDAERADLVLHTFEDAVRRHGKPEMVIHDKGSAFWSWRGIARFTRLLEEMDVTQIAASKTTNGKVENFNGNLQKELFDPHRFYDLAEMRRRLAAHLHWFNQRRTHHALGGLLVPADRFYGRVDEVMARIEAGVAADASDTLQLRDRVLELFKVNSVGGQTEVWLMGHKLLG